MRPAWLRTLPALVVLALFALGAQAPRAAREQAAPTMPLPYFVACEQLAEASSGDSLYDFATGSSLVQPFDGSIPMAACSLSVSAVGWSNMRLSLQDWDPVTLLPEPHAIALRIVDLNPSALQYYTVNRAPRVAISPPLITRSVTGVADPPPTTVAMQMIGTSSFGGFFRGHFALDGPANLPPARYVDASLSLPLPGPHPVIAHSICTSPGDAGLARITQAVTHADVLLPKTDEWLQYFRVPSVSDLCWIELAIMGNDGSNYLAATPRIQILDVTAAPEPDLGLPSGFTQSLFSNYYFAFNGGRQSVWAIANSFDHTFHFEPGHVYALRISNVRTHDHYARTLTGTESSAFQYGIGKLYARDSSSATWTEQPNRALAFKLVAIPSNVVVGVRPGTGPAFALQVAPNPSHGVAEVSWSGAVGPVSLDVLDARGRRVASGNGGAAGHWQWTARRGNGILPAGVYFVRARDSEGGVVTERLVVVR